MHSRLLFVCLLFVAAVAGAQESVSSAIVPVVGTMPGPGCLWRTDVEIINDTGSAAEVAMELATADAGAIFFDLGPGATQHFPDIAQAFGVQTVLSPLRVTSNTRRALTVHATVYALIGTEVSKPQLIANYHGEAWYPLRALDGLSFTDDMRTNIGLVNFGDREAEFFLALQRVPGRNLAVSHIVVGAQTLLHTSIQSLFPLISKGDGFTIVVETNARETYVYGSVIDNSQTARFVEPRVATR